MLRRRDVDARVEFMRGWGHPRTTGGDGDRISRCAPA